MSRVVLASGNAGKIREFQALIADFELVSQAQWAVPEVEETGLSFVENALLKARHAARCCQLPALADDSGLVVPALHGAPGVRSARYAGPTASDAENWQKLLNELDGKPAEQRQAYFVCVLVWLRHAEDPLPLIAQGLWRGTILTAARGGNGFGYDPVFWLPELNCTAAELSAEQKNARSHRAQALQDLRQQLAAL